MLTRRRFLVTSGAALGASVVAPATTLGQGKRGLRGARFAEGVMSGDPTPSAITLWTRLDGAEGNGTVQLEVARDKGFRRMVASETLTARAGQGHALKVRVGKLDPREEYYYRFATDDRDSDVGRFRTAPAPDSNDEVTFAFFSCQSWQSGYFTPHALMAREDLDFVINLGDYVYADRQAQDSRVRNDPVAQAVSLEQYRDKYRLYHSDANLQKMQAQFAMVSTWDDHELKNDYAGNDPDKLPQNAFTRKQQANAYRAFFESMPLIAPDRKTRLFRALDFGRNVELLVLDQRQYRDAQPCNGGETSSRDTCADLGDPRTMLGPEQGRFITERLAASQATWKVIANEVMVTPIKLTGSTFVSPDTWPGYEASRQELLAAARATSDVVFVTGDIHTFITTSVPTSIDDPTPLAAEFVGGSVTSYGIAQTDLDIGGGTTLKGDPDATSFDPGLLNALLGLNPWAVEAEVVHHGYAVAKASPTSFDVSYKRLESVRKKRSPQLPALRYALPKGEKRPIKQ